MPVEKFASVPSEFFTQPTLHLAQKLLGCYLIHELPQATLIGEIVETEAYLYPDDPAAHSYRGQTPRTEVMFQSGGLLYVYFTYGMHYCFNITSSHPGEAVLIRALQPVSGLDQMRINRGAKISDHNLMNGPAKAAQAMGIAKQHNGTSLLTSPLWLGRSKNPIQAENIIATPRIGISQGKNLPYRFYLKNSQWISGK